MVEASIYSTPLPSKSDVQQDHWGYYNGNGATTLRPKIYVYSGFPGRVRFNYFALPNIEPLIVVGTADRSVNPRFITAGVLEEVTYPTGGSTRFVYEPNSFFDNDANAEIQGGGLRVKQMISDVGERQSDGSFTYIETRYDYTDNNGRSSGILIQKPEYVQLDLEQDFENGETLAEQFEAAITISNKSLISTTDYEGLSVSYTQVRKSQTDNGSVVYNYHAPRNYIDDNDFVNFELTNDAADATDLLAGSGTHIFPYLRLGDHFIDEDNGDTDALIPYGKLLRMRTFREDGKILLDESYTYETISVNTSPEPVVGLVVRNDRGQRIVWGEYKHLTNAMLVQSRITSNLFEQVGNDFKRTIVENEYTTGDKIFLRSSITLHPDNSHTRVENLYNFDYDLTNATTNNAMVSGLLALRGRRQSAPVIEQVNYLRKIDWATERVVDAKLTLWNSAQVSGRTNVVRPERTLDLEIETTLTPFTQAGIDNSGNFAFDGNYELLTRYDAYDRRDNLLTMVPQNGIKRQELWGYNGDVMIAEALAVDANQFSYFGIENRLNAADDNQGWNVVAGNEYSEDAYAGASSRKINPFATNGTSRSFTSKEGTDKYIFSAWVKTSPNFGATANGQLAISIIDFQNAFIVPFTTITTNFGNTQGEWQYKTVEVDLKAIREEHNLPSDLPLRLTCSSRNTSEDQFFLIDEIRFRPSPTLMSTMSYDIGYGMSATIDINNKGTFTTFDGFGRPILQRNFKQDITERRSYDLGEELVVDPNFICQIEFATATCVINNFCNFGAGFTYEWDFGDGTTITTSEALVTHTYSEGGFFPITARVIANGTNQVVGQSGSNFQITLPTSSSFNTLEFIQTECNTVAFEASFAGDVDHYTYNFGDGTVPQIGTNTITHNYTSNTSNIPEFKVAVTAHDASGLVLHEFDTLLIAYQLVEVQTNQTAAQTYDLLAEHDACLNASQYQWDFGDGTSMTTSSATVTHVYPEDGIYELTLTIRDAAGNIVANEIEEFILNSTSIVSQ